ncbi:Glyco_18 domain-containing protein [Caenorhabditis elegans]|uniref:Glyco_18 domain-containing protein n=1 Tax=Caenorhabditis elegans TaxID=6239 RepID=O44609_CAEEL|nr:Glyco_18 domain-containing protein [Caenorhabditis elegans]CCD68889.1 Glyco_18 domain-containing protein [Caenorhabditis elegans]|eukprot:NP_503420.3 CHItinase-Like [Caenorhabditis elegans]
MYYRLAVQRFFDHFSTSSMILNILLLFFPVVSAEFDFKDLKWQPDLITKESILQNNGKLTVEPLFEGMTQLAFVTPWNPRGFMLARKRAARLTYISPVWFRVHPLFDTDQELSDVGIYGKKDINPDFIRALRKSNPDIKIVPRFYFDEFKSAILKEFVVKEALAQKVGQTLANFCHKHGFDGLVIDLYSTFVDVIANSEFRLDALETIEHIGKVIRKNELTAILSFPAVVNVIEEENGSPKSVFFISSEECSGLVAAYYHLQLWTYTDALKGSRKYVNDEFIYHNLHHCGFSPKLMIGINFYGIELNLKGATTITAKRFLQVLKGEDSVFKFNEESKEHMLLFERNKSTIIFPTLTTLEHRIALAKKFNASISIWDYGPGLDYFTNLV